VRANIVAAAIGVALTIGGVVLLAVAVSLLVSLPVYDECVGDACLNDLAYLAFPGSIIGIVFGLILASWALGSIREERQEAGPLRAFGFMSGLGGVFVAVGAIFIAGARAAGGSSDGTFIFLGASFALLGVGLMGVDLVRFRANVNTDRLRSSGLHGTARVITMANTNFAVNGVPVVNLELEVTLPGHAPFRTRRRTLISRLGLGVMLPGADIAVLADPAKPNAIVLDWEGTPPE